MFRRKKSVKNLKKRIKNMKESELKIGIKVKAILREDGKHIVLVRS